MNLSLSFGFVHPLHKRLHTLQINKMRVWIILTAPLLASLSAAVELQFRNPSDHDHPGVNQVWPEGREQIIAFTWDDDSLKDFLLELWVNCTMLEHGEVDRLSYLEQVLPGSPFTTQAAEGGLESLPWTPTATNKTCIEPVYYVAVVDPQDRSQAWASPNFNISSGDDNSSPKPHPTTLPSDIGPLTVPSDPASTNWPSGPANSTYLERKITPVEGIGIGIGAFSASVIIAIVLKCWVVPWVGGRARTGTRQYGAELH
ncbi:hypothetical protein P171DRAFT_444395 [Karstenula rhodostoma CBS 690.94]|uniref:Uncharacterized protein n=1 Tax=Karstenula rhodostoma CBS 690.94 TaxID=1392251 RepID=A0A9P4PHR6_9PLEO|nr:hypothetical protein P171DRAFT_444395 [Karstenula rhodostoma CBS 690.94]